MKVLLVLSLAFVAVSSLPAGGFYDEYYDLFFPFHKYNRDRTIKKTAEAPAVVIDVGSPDSSEEEPSFFDSFFRPFFVNPFADFFSRGSWFDDLDDSNKNTTVFTKVVDGHNITVNETTYENAEKGTFYKFQVIDISPLLGKGNDESSTEGKPAVSEVTEQENPKPVETDATEGLPSNTINHSEIPDSLKPDKNSQDNIIDREERFAAYELQGDDPSVYGNNVEIFNTGYGPEKRNTPADLSSDIRVNRLLAENNRRGGLFMVPPEVEVFDTIDYDNPYENYQQPQEIVNSNFNQEILQPQINQEVVRPYFNQQQI